MRAALLGAFALVASCRQHDVTVQYYLDAERVSWSDRRAVQDIADTAFRDVRVLLPTLPPQVTLEIQLGKAVIPETGETGTTSQPAALVWTVDPDRDFATVVHGHLRASLFHELHHLARERFVRRRTLLDHVVTEGLASAFERDFAKVDPPWAKAPPEIIAWTHEVLRQPPDAPVHEWMIRHPDGRRWIGMRVGTFLVDRAAHASGRSAAALVAEPAEEIVRLAAVP